MKRYLIAGLLVFALTQPASAAIKGCFTRTYDAAHLAKHKGQDVTFMAVQIGFEGDAEDDQNLLQLRFRGATTMWLNGFVCVERAGDTRCKIIDSAHDYTLGGSFVLKQKGDNVLLVPEGDLNLAWEGTTEPNTLNVATNPEHKNFKLNRLGTKQCPAL
jgi:hypothetical protein